MHALILVLWGDTKIAHWRKAKLTWPVWLWICTSKFLTIHSRIAKCIKQALNTTDVHNFHFLLLWLSELQIAALSKASMQDNVLYGDCLTSVYLWSTAQYFLLIKTTFYFMICMCVVDTRVWHFGFEISLFRNFSNF